MREATTSEPSRAGVWMLPYRGTWPRLHRDVWVAPGAAIIGDVEIGADSSLWFGTVVRGDVHSIRIGERTNLQDHCVVHVTRDQHAAEIGSDVSVGHRATVHGCRVEDGALVGMGATLLDGAVVGEEAWIAAGALVPPGARIPPRSLALGVPARVVRTLDDGELRTQRDRTRHYVELSREYRQAGAP